MDRETETGRDVVLGQKSEPGTDVPEERYRADLELLDRHQAFSSEIIRLSLLGVAGVAFFIARMVSQQSSPPSFRDLFTGVLPGISSLLFLLAMAWALTPRYHSFDGFFDHIPSIRLATGGELKIEQAEDTARKRNLIHKKIGEMACGGGLAFRCGGNRFRLRFWPSASSLVDQRCPVKGCSPR